MDAELVKSKLEEAKQHVKIAEKYQRQCRQSTLSVRAVLCIHVLLVLGYLLHIESMTQGVVMASTIASIVICALSNIRFRKLNAKFNEAINKSTALVATIPTTKKTPDC